jgi:hypothetical protein
MKLTKSKERVSEFGEVFTPENIVFDMIKLIPDDKWKDPSFIVLEPTCGNGNFVVEVIQKKIDSGLSVYNALNTTFGMDIMDDNIQECICRVLNRFVFDEVPKNKYLLMTCVVVNNIFTVKDSLEYIKDGTWELKKFYKDDPTVKVKKKKPIELLLDDDETSQVLDAVSRMPITVIAENLLKRVGV